MIIFSRIIFYSDVYFKKTWDIDGDVLLSEAVRLTERTEVCYVHVWCVYTSQAFKYHSSLVSKVIV